MYGEALQLTLGMHCVQLKAPLPIISNSFLIYLNKHALCLPQLEVFE